MSFKGNVNKAAKEQKGIEGNKRLLQVLTFFGGSTSLLDNMVEENEVF